MVEGLRLYLMGQTIADGPEGLSVSHSHVVDWSWSMAMGCILWGVLSG